MTSAFQIKDAPQIASLDIFRSMLGSLGDLAKVARFGVLIDNIVSGSQAAQALMMLCEAAEMPGRALNTDDARYYGPNFKTPFQSAYTDINLTFLCRSEMDEKAFFDRWMEQINPKSTYDFAYRDSYATTINIFQFAEQGKATYKATLRKAYPIQVAPLPMNWAEDNFHRLNVTFAYTDWVTAENINASAFSLVPGATITNNSTIPTSSFIRG